MTCVAVAAAAMALLGGTPHDAGLVVADVMAGPVGEWIGADGGVPVELADGSTLVLFGDTFVGPNDGQSFPAGWGMVHSSAIHIDGDSVTVMTEGLLRGTPDSYYWIADAFDDGADLWVVAHEVRTSGVGLFGFEVVDMDLFRVREPLAWQSWRLAEKFEDGWWDGRDVQFVDSDPSIAVVRPKTGVADRRTVGYDTGSGATFELNHPRTDSLFIPTEHDGAWWAVTWDMWDMVTTVVTAPSITGPWVEVAEHRHTVEAGEWIYGSQVHVIDGALVVQWSNNSSTDLTGLPLSAIRPAYVLAADLAEVS